MCCPSCKGYMWFWWKLTRVCYSISQIKDRTYSEEMCFSLEVRGPTKWWWRYYGESKQIYTALRNGVANQRVISCSEKSWAQEVEQTITFTVGSRCEEVERPHIYRWLCCVMILWLGYSWPKWRQLVSCCSTAAEAKRFCESFYSVMHSVLTLLTMTLTVPCPSGSKHYAKSWGTWKSKRWKAEKCPFFFQVSYVKPLILLRQGQQLVSVATMHVSPLRGVPRLWSFV